MNYCWSINWEGNRTFQVLPHPLPPKFSGSSFVSVYVLTIYVIPSDSTISSRPGFLRVKLYQLSQMCTVVFLTWQSTNECLNINAQAYPQTAIKPVAWTQVRPWGICSLWNYLTVALFSLIIPKPLRCA